MEAIREIPSGFSVGCYLSYPLSFGNLYASVDGYTNGDLTGDAGPLAARSAPDGNLWFTESNAGQIGRITLGKS